MRRIFIPLALIACPLWSIAGPATGGGVPVPSQRAEAVGQGAFVEQNADQRRAALRQALVLPPVVAPGQADATPARQLSPAERAELRRQLREQPGR